MRYRSAILLTLWTAMIGPVLAMPTPWSGAQSRELMPIKLEEKRIELPRFEQVFLNHK